ncbi:iron complex transport system permease protein [Herbihabitans rhizosphaerae]|uniref:Iron complex transport system permease protein n=1 Tax=Herbihabitans rhizosphaerae TaxID=1872711 RepID=A0A4Q7KXX2_9PSEU|nr:iron chelate uptake ABC transporter family permease subunit [Herbihabitans rhizosphaerae]RZS41200.1 iron complex transport system permease protein [Herbihabitans rhizosphaerae]
MTGTTAAATAAPRGARVTSRRRRTIALVLLLVALAAASAASICLGAKAIPLHVVLDALTSPQDIEQHIIVRSLRVPRTVFGLLVGIALGIAGTLIQGHTRNPLADPGLLGVTQGAAFAVVTAVVVLGVDSLYGYVWFAVLGALAASVTVFALGSAGGRGASPVTLALAGAAVSFFLHGLTSAIVLVDERGMDVFRFWSVGSIAARDYAIAGQIAPFLIVGLILAAINTPGMNTLALGDDVAVALGTNVARTRVLGVLAITLLTGAAVAACGPIAFVGLVVPHLARAITGPDYRWVVPFAGLIGAVLLLVADVLGRVLASDAFEVGIMLALIGAPVFIVLVRRTRLVRL